MGQPVSAAVLEAIFLEALGLQPGQDEQTKALASLHLRDVRPTLEGLAALSRTDSADPGEQRRAAQRRTEQRGAEQRGAEQRGAEQCPAQAKPPAAVGIARVAGKRGPKSRPRSAPTASEYRLLSLLDRPRRAIELAALLGVTHQRVHQILAALRDRDLVRTSDEDGRLAVVAGKQDTSILLPLEQERILNRLRDSEATTITEIVRVSHWPAAKIARLLQSLQAAGLVEQTGTTPRGDLYRLTAAGAAHWQRAVTARRASAPPPPPLPCRSDRVRSVLACLAEHGPIRTRDIGLKLSIPQPSINALMQYLKRKGMVRVQNDAHFAPHMLTAQGHDTLTAMGKAATSA